MLSFSRSFWNQHLFNENFSAKSSYDIFFISIVFTVGYIKKVCMNFINLYFQNTNFLTKIFQCSNGTREMRAVLNELLHNRWIGGWRRWRHNQLALSLAGFDFMWFLFVRFNKEKKILPAPPKKYCSKESFISLQFLFLKECGQFLTSASWRSRPEEGDIQTHI